MITAKQEVFNETKTLAQFLIDRGIDNQMALESAAKAFRQNQILETQQILKDLAFQGCPGLTYPASWAESYWPEDDDAYFPEIGDEDESEA